MEIINGNKVEKVFMIDGYECVILAVSTGHRCGYVGLPKSHRCNGVLSSEIENMGDIDVHGGITFTDYGELNYPIRNSDRYFVGFDCGHYYDAKDLNILNELGTREDFNRYSELQKIEGNHDKVKSNQYVEEELIGFVKQLKDIDNFRSHIDKLKRIQRLLQNIDASSFKNFNLIDDTFVTEEVLLDHNDARELIKTLQDINLDNIK